MSNDLEDFKEEMDIRGRFPTFGPGVRLMERAIAEWRSTAPTDRDALRDRIRFAACYANAQFQQNAYFRDCDMRLWFEIDALAFDEVARRGQELSERWERERLAGLPPEEDEEAWERLYAAEDAAEEESHRIARLEDEGAYGRTVGYHPEHDRYVYIRFGKMPKDGYSHFGLAGEDTEDGPDPWRVETGGKWRESGTSVFRAYHHPDRPGHYVLIQPHFDLAMYGVDGLDSHLLAVVPDEENPTVLRVDGSVVTCKGFDRTRRVELGSDGEYLIDAKTVTAIEELTVERIWISDRAPLTDLLSRRSRSYGR